MKTTGGIEITEQLFNEKPEIKTWPTRTIARYLLKEYPSVFSNIDNARRSVNYLRQTDGKKSRGKARRSPFKDSGLAYNKRRI